ncbi:MAG: PAS domain S-box protein [Proteobacteria bacterium]|nr:PAS domain S-box protein [Pseudomonadota bacterium]
MASSPQLVDTREEFLRKLKWLMFFRVVIITFLLGSTVLVHFKKTSTYLETYLLCLYGIIVCTYLLTLGYALFITHIKNLPLFAYFQIFFDLVFVTIIVYVTGGFESVFSFLYILSIINASILLYRRGGFIIASASSILYGACLDLEYYGLIPSISGNIPSVLYYKASDIFYTIAMNITGFYATAFLSSLLSEQTRRSKKELKEKEIDFKQLEALHNNIVQSINTGILTLNQNDEITSFNKAAQEITGYSIFEVLGKKFDRIFPPSKNNLQNNDQNTNQKRFLQRSELPFSRSDRIQIILGFSVSILRDTLGNKTGKIFTFRDVTRYREMEKQIKQIDRLAAVGQLAAGIAHEIRNPLTSLSGSIQVLQDELNLDNENCQLMNIALRESKRLNGLISDFLLFAHPGEVEKNKLNLTSLVEDTISLFLNGPECRKNIKVTKLITPNLFMEGNEKQISQVLWNVLKNGVQSQPQGGSIHIAAKIENREHPLSKSISLSRIKLSVKDKGCGIPQGIQEKIFDPFFTTKELGSGLGLAITYRIIENHGGEIIIHSKENEGTEVVIYFPLTS